MKIEDVQNTDEYEANPIKMQFVKGKFPQKSGNYIVRYKGKIGRDDFTTNGNHWWNTGTKNDQLDVEWAEESFKELGL